MRRNLTQPGVAAKNVASNFVANGADLNICMRIKYFTIRTSSKSPELQM